jgi:hypothetical protein
MKWDPLRPVIDDEWLPLSLICLRPRWIHEIKHDGYRLMARRDPVGVRRG